MRKLWPVSVRRDGEFDRIAVQDREAHEFDILDVVAFVWGFIERKPQITYLVIDLDVPPQLLAAICLRIGQYYPCVAVGGVVVKSRMAEHPLGSVLE